MNTLVIDPSLLVPAGKALLFGAMGFAFIQWTNLTLSTEQLVVRTVLATLAITFFASALTSLNDLSELLTRALSRVFKSDSTGQLIGTVLGRALHPRGNEKTGDLNIPAGIEQIWRLGVWGTLTQIVEAVFLLSSAILKCAHQVIWNCLVFLFPVFIGLSPVFRSPLISATLYSIELSLWQPLLTIIDGVGAKVAEKHLLDGSELGLSLAAIEVISVLLILGIPAFAHRLVSSQLSGDFGLHDSIRLKSLGAIASSRNCIERVGRSGGGKAVILAVLLTSGLLGSFEAFAATSITLYPGYVTKVECEGKLLASAVGNTTLVLLEALPREIGCGVLLKPKQSSARTNLILETSSGSIERTIDIVAEKFQPASSQLKILLKAAPPSGGDQ